MEKFLIGLFTSEISSRATIFSSTSPTSFTIANRWIEYRPIKKARKKKKSHCRKFKVGIASSPPRPLNVSVQSSSHPAKKSANLPPKTGAIPAANELKILIF